MDIYPGYISNHQFICIIIAAIVIATPAIVFLCMSRHIAGVAIARLAIGGDSDADELVAKDIYPTQ